MSNKPLSDSMRQMLTKVADGKSPTWGLVSRSAHGGATATYAALHQRGMLEKGSITPAGLQAIGRAS